ncbi:MAG: sigma-70 family RNA polymerase sigma factor [Cyanobacteria bacterium]|nr:sigma-70 family RNA polymerase sigma factor [Cyanobacteriota bacterium]MDW8201407.1 sigma-70 family RNA polymerase sigma factor [Cyanobacteriota bacterium SKYGB_h_bin112]
MQTLNLPEWNHPLVKSLASVSDRELVMLFQQHPEAGRYFIAIFCRYSPLVHTLIRHSVRSPVQADYLFALTWRHIYYELRGLDLAQLGESKTKATLQHWLINVTAHCINQASLPPVESIRYILSDAPPPLWCYLEQAMDQIPPILRLIIVMAETFHWGDTRISAYLQAEGERITAKQVRAKLQEGYRLLQSMLPSDVRAIYLGHEELSVSAPDTNPQGVRINANG